MVLFDDFECMDIFGPAEILGKLQKYFHIRYLSVSGDVINSVQGGQDMDGFPDPGGGGRYSSDSGRKRSAAPSVAG